MSQNNKSSFRRILRYFLQGLIIIAPISITLYVTWLALSFVDNILPFRFPGLGILVIISAITLIGFLAGTIIARPLLKYFNRTINKTPLLSVIFKATREMLGAFVGKKKKFTQPVLVVVNKETGMEKLGFITCRDLSLLGIGGEKIAVYMPHSFNFSGNLFIVRSEYVTPLDAPPSDVIQFIVSGGVIDFREEDEIIPKTS